MTPPRVLPSRPHLSFINDYNSNYNHVFRRTNIHHQTPVSSYSSALKAQGYSDSWLHLANQSVQIYSFVREQSLGFWLVSLRLTCYVAKLQIPFPCNIVWKCFR
jgi:hypothetical protein